MAFKGGTKETQNQAAFIVVQFSDHELVAARDRKREADPFAHVQPDRGGHRRAGRGHRVREEALQRAVRGVPQLHRTGPEPDQHLREPGGAAEAVHQVQQQDYLHEGLPLVQAAPLHHAREPRSDVRRRVRHDLRRPQGPLHARLHHRVHPAHAPHRPARRQAQGPHEILIAYQSTKSPYNYSIMKRLVRSRRFHILFFESLGSFILVYGACSAGLHVAPDIIVAASFFLAVGLTGEVTGGYINPLITLGTYVERRHNKLALYLSAQLLGALLGGLWSWALLGEIEAPYEEGWESLEPVKFILNELVGSLIFTVCVLVLTNRYTSHATKSWQIYLSIPVALFLVRKLTGSTVINPAAGIALQLIAAFIKADSLVFLRDVWPLFVPSVLGGLLGGYFMLKFYEPLLLYIKYKELAEGEGEGEQEEGEEEGEGEGEGEEAQGYKNPTMIED